MPHATLPLLVVFFVGCASENGLYREREAPVVEITSPEWGDLQRQGDTLLAVVGSVADSYDAPDELQVSLTANGVSLPTTVDADGTVTADYPLIDADLGALSFVLLAVDSDGDMAEAAVEVLVLGPLGPPTVLITTPGDEDSFEPGDTLAFQGVGTDLTTAPDDLRFDWTSDLDGDLLGAISSDGTSALITDGLSEGDHLITLTATDEDGETGSDAILIHIGEPVIVEEPIEEEAQPGDVIFSEMNVNPETVDDEIGEWVELYNTASYPVDIGGYTFRDDDIDGWELAGPLVVESHGYIVLCADLNSALNGGVPCDGWFFRDWNGDGLALANGPDELVLARPDGTEIDWLYYDDDWFTPAVAIGVDPSYLDAGDNDDLASWCNQTTVTAPMVEPGTPGGPNDPCF